MDPTELACGMSFLSLVTKEKELFDQTVEFYSKLGFVAVEEYNTDMDCQYVGTASHAQNAILEKWMTSCFPVHSAHEKGSKNSVRNDLPVSSFGATIKIRLIDSGLSFENTAAKKKLLEDEFKKTDWRGLAPSFVFYVKDIAAAGKVLSNGGEHTVQYRPSESASLETYGYDPLGTLIGFTTRRTPFSIPDARTVSDQEVELYDVKKIEQALTSNGDKPKKRIAIMTSGGDAPGMNACVRAVVRAAISRGCDAFAIYEGYEGLLRGGEYIKQMSWDDVRGYLCIGGTSIGTARCAGFRERSGRLTAAHNLIKHGIDALVVCGGDGSLTGADLFRSEWPSLVKELVDTNVASPQDIKGHEHLYICGLVGSIDNDMSSTDATIGAFSSLDRICQAVDYIDATAQSHSRAFVIEVMGRHCGWLALMAGLACGADFIFIPEKPPKKDEWATTMCDIVQRHRKKGMRKTIVIVAEGAIDSDLNSISADDVKDVLVKIGLDTRVTTLGHVQRGGTAVAFDRFLATLQGIDAVDAILSSTPETPSPMIGIQENKIVRRNLMEAVALTKKVADCIGKKDFDGAMELRDQEFSEHLRNFLTINTADLDEPRHPAEKRLNFAVISVGAPAGGMNAALRAAACYCFSRGHKLYAIHNGWSGLARHESVRDLTWIEVEEWANKGGCEIGTNRALPEVDLGMIAYYFQKYKFDGLMIIGGFEAYNSLHQLEEARAAYPAFRIPMVVLPATISNNVPGTEYSLGTDTCLNALVEYNDVIRQSASSTRRRVFVVEVQGGNSGYIAAYTALVCGAYAVYTPEEGISFAQLGSDIKFLKKCFAADQGRERAGRLIIRNEKASKTFSTEDLTRIIQNEADNKFEAREAIPGHVQQGGSPSPMDRARATRLAIRSMQFLEQYQETRQKKHMYQGEMYTVAGIRSSHLLFTPIEPLWDLETEQTFRRPNRVFWNSLIAAADMLTGRPRVSADDL